MTRSFVVCKQRSHGFRSIDDRKPARGGRRGEVWNLWVVVSQRLSKEGEMEFEIVAREKTTTTTAV